MMVGLLLSSPPPHLVASGKCDRVSPKWISVPLFLFVLFFLGLVSFVMAKWVVGCRIFFLAFVNFVLCYRM